MPYTYVGEVDDAETKIIELKAEIIELTNNLKKLESIILKRRSLMIDIFQEEEDIYNELYEQMMKVLIGQ